MAVAIYIWISAFENAIFWQVFQAEPFLQWLAVNTDDETGVAFAIHRCTRFLCVEVHSMCFYNFNKFVDQVLYLTFIALNMVNMLWKIQVAKNLSPLEIEVLSSWRYSGLIHTRNRVKCDREWAFLSWSVSCLLLSRNMLKCDKHTCRGESPETGWNVISNRH